MIRWFLLVLMLAFSAIALYRRKQEGKSLYPENAREVLYIVVMAGLILSAGLYLENQYSTYLNGILPQ